MIRRNTLDPRTGRVATARPTPRPVAPIVVLAPTDPTTPEVLGPLPHEKIAPVQLVEETKFTIAAPVVALEPVAEPVESETTREDLLSKPPFGPEIRKAIDWYTAPTQPSIPSKKNKKR